MSSKPTKVPTWATGTAFVQGPLPGKPTKVYPSSGKAVEGFYPDEKPPAQNINALFGKIGEWCQYLNDGDLTGDHSITGDLDVTGDGTVGGTLDVTGAVALGSTLAVTGLITATAGVTAAANQHVTVSGTGELKHGDRVLALPGCVGKSATNANVTYGATVGNIEATAAIDMVFPIPLRVGDRIKSITFARYGDSSANITNAEVLKVSSAGSGASLGATTVSNPPAGYNDTTIDLTDTTLASGETFFFVVTVNEANIRIHNIRVTYDRP